LLLCRNCMRREIGEADTEGLLRKATAAFTFASSNGGGGGACSPAAPAAPLAAAAGGALDMAIASRKGARERKK